ncbi:MAG: hypothetical protein EBY45_17710 [Gammaproteobacteria bacterium]|nr:hypothetical protein [Gammaproteobacteria bacterium]
MGLREGLPGTIYRADYEAPHFGIDTVAMNVRIFEGRTEVTAALVLERLSSAAVTSVRRG